MSELFDYIDKKLKKIFPLETTDLQLETISHDSIEKERRVPWGYQVAHYLLYFADFVTTGKGPDIIRVREYQDPLL